MNLFDEIAAEEAIRLKGSGKATESSPADMAGHHATLSRMKTVRGERGILIGTRSRVAATAGGKLLRRWRPKRSFNSSSSARAGH